MVLTKKQITESLAGARAVPAIGDVEDIDKAVTKLYPGAKREGSSGGWSWMLDGVCVAASNPILRPPHDRHWVAIRKQEEKEQ